MVANNRRRDDMTTRDDLFAMHTRECIMSACYFFLHFFLRLHTNVANLVCRVAYFAFYLVSTRRGDRIRGNMLQRFYFPRRRTDNLFPEIYFARISLAALAARRSD